MHLASQFNVADQIVIMAVFVLSLNLLMGVAGQASMAPAAFGAVGGYTAALLAIHLHLPLPVILLGAMAMSGLVGAVVGVPALRLSSEYLILLTLAVSYVVLALASSLPGLGGQFGLFGIPAMSLAGHQFITPTQRFPLLLVIGLLSLAFVARIVHSGHGRVLRAIREEELATRSLGRPTVQIKVTVFAASAALAGLAGALLVYYDQIISPAQFSLTVSISIITMMVIGGSGSLVGSVVGAIVIEVTTPILQDVVRLKPGTAQDVQSLVYGALLIAIVVFRPQGIVPERIRKTSLAPVARFDSGSTPEVAAGASPPQLSAHGITKSFGGIRALRHVELDLPPAEVTALIGPNGAGKSTLFRVLTGDLVPDEGTVTLGGQDLRGLPPDRVAALGMVRSFQDVRPFRRLTALENVMVAVPGQKSERLWQLYAPGRGVGRDEERCRQVASEHLGFVGLAGKATVPASDLSYAEQKLVAIARVLATGAEVLLLDEPTSGVDAESLGRIAEVVRGLPALGRTVCIVEHNLAFLAMLGSSCLFMEAGTIAAQGSLEQLMARPDLRNAYFGNRKVRT